MSGGSRKVALVAAVVAATLLPHPAVGDQRDELAETRRRLGQVEAVLGDARADAGAVAAALAAADQAVAEARGRLAVVTAELAAARRRRADALVALEAATDEVGRQEARLAEQVRGAYMTGRVTGLAVVVQATDLRDLVERGGHPQLCDQRRPGRPAPPRPGPPAGRAAPRRHGQGRAGPSSGRPAPPLGELRRLIRQEELARRRAAGGGGGSILGPGPPCDLSGTSAAERWIIMKESSGYPTADNPASTAFGLGQLLLGNRILYLGEDYATTDCGRQLWAFRAYVHDRYGTAARAKAFWQANGWY
jgi:hypothetical protein